MRQPRIARPETGAGTGSPARATIAILDFGSQYTQVIARRVRDARVYCEIFPHDVTLNELRARNVIGVILSGGPASVYEPGAPRVERAVISGDLPVLGICYGMQLMAYELGGDVVAEGKREYGPATVDIAEASGIFEGLASRERAWVSHGDSVRRPPDGFAVVARTSSVPIAAMSDGARRWAVQFHPEVAHTPRGAEILRNFLYRVCGAAADWTPAAFVDEASRAGLVGGRDAAVLVQGTIYPDVIESRSRDSKTSARIKTHHNVGGLPEVMALEVVEPLRRLFKDEVRHVGAELGIPEDILWRHPFPGPGLAVRVIGSIDRERLELLRRADAIFLEELRAAGLYRQGAAGFP